MKVSKPVLILCIALLLLAGYIHFFTGKKKPRGPVPPTPPAKTQTQPAAKAGQPPQAVQQAPAKPAEAPPQVSLLPKPRFDKLNVGWASDPFLLPKIKEGRKRDGGSAVRLVAILEKGNERVAIIDRDVVKKGDMIGDEKVIEIGRNKVVLARGGVKRTLVLVDADAIATAGEALTTKQKGTERAK